MTEGHDKTLMREITIFNSVASKEVLFHIYSLPHKRPFILSFGEILALYNNSNKIFPYKYYSICVPVT